jgi:hypothetical protein
MAPAKRTLGPPHFLIAEPVRHGGRLNINVGATARRPQNSIVFVFCRVPIFVASRLSRCHFDANGQPLELERGAITWLLPVEEPDHGYRCNICGFKETDDGQ